MCIRLRNHRWPQLSMGAAETATDPPDSVAAVAVAAVAAVAAVVVAAAAAVGG